MNKKRINPGCLFFLVIAVFAVILGIIFAVKSMQYSAESNTLQKAMDGALEMTGDQVTGSKIISYHYWENKFDTYGLPEDMIAETAEDVRYIAYYYPGETLVGSYRDSSAKGYQRTVEVRLHDLKTGEDIAKETFRGTNPPSETTHTSGNVYGDSPDTKEISRWIESLILVNEQNG